MCKTTKAKLRLVLGPVTTTCLAAEENEFLLGHLILFASTVILVNVQRLQLTNTDYSYICIHDHTKIQTSFMYSETDCSHHDSILVMSSYYPGWWV